ncbi:MAG: DUF1206 domain-containing protein [Cyanobacteria bacterium J06627_32]
MALSNQQGTSHSDWIEYYARFGYAAKGVLYGGIGFLALLEAMNVSGGKTTSSTGVLKTIASQPYGQILLAVITVSLTGYVVWRFIQAIVDPEHDGHGAKDVARRVGYAWSGLVYAGIAFSAAGILMSSTSSSGSNGGKTEQDWALMVMQQPFGRWIVGAGGVLFFGLGCYYFYRAIRAKFRKRMKLHEMSSVEQNWATLVGRTGITARGVVYVVIGISVARAALAFDPSAIKTTEDVLAIFNQNPADEIFLSILGIGFIAYGIHMGFQARYRRIEPED